MRRVLLLVALSGLLGACDPPRGEVRAWQPSDHDGTRAPGRQTPQDGVNKDASLGVAETVWQKTCASCHGAAGRGDGPLGPSMSAPDLTRPEWLAATSDEDIAKVIREGRNKMPAHADLPASTVDALVKRIRSKGR